MDLGTKAWLAVLLMLAAAADARALTEQQKSLLQKIDQMEQMDRMSFVETNSDARECIHRRDFACAEKKIAAARGYVNSSRDQEALEQTKRSLESEKKTVAAEAEADRQRQEREARAQSRSESAQAQQGGFQWGKFAALSAGIAIGGKGLSGDKLANTLAGAAMDSQAGVQGVGNFQSAVQQASQGGGSSGSSGGGAQSLEQRKAIGKACVAEGERMHPYNDGQLDPFCQQATADACLWKRVIPTPQEREGMEQIRAEGQNACERLKSIAPSMNADPNACAACR